MTAREKFIARLEELGLYEEWRACGDKAGKVLEDGSIVVLIHYEWEPRDEYTEIFYPPFNELRENEQFVRNCRHEYFQSDDEHFVVRLARWLEYGGDGCPLHPVDVYCPGDGCQKSWHNFEDDDAAAAKQAIKAIADKFGLHVSFK